MIRNSYEKFLNHFGITEDEFVKWGLEESFSFFKGKDKDIEDKWKKLLDDIKNKKEIPIRTPQKSTIDIYNKHLSKFFKVKEDKDGNKSPCDLIGELTRYYKDNGYYMSKNDKVINYKLSHIWGFTKNPYLFNAPWNIMYTPVIIDPLTGHDSKGTTKDIFKEEFLKSDYYNNVIKKYRDEYNDILKNFKDDIEKIIRGLQDRGDLTPRQAESLISNFQFLDEENIFESK